MLVNRACAVLSRKFAARVVCCSEASLRVHRELSYAPEKLEVIPNGFDLNQVKPDPTARVSVRQELGIPPDTPLIGIAARFHPLKDHHNFIQAAARLHKKIPGVHLLLCGLGITWQNPQLAGWIRAAGIRDSFHLLPLPRYITPLSPPIHLPTPSSRLQTFPPP